MQVWLIFLSGMIIGSVTGIFVMCLCALSGWESRKEERRKEIASFQANRPDHN